MKKSRFTQVKTAFLESDPAEARTQDPQIKSLLLYQLSYEVKVCFSFQNFNTKITRNFSNRKRNCLYFFGEKNLVKLLNNRLLIIKINSV